MPLPAARRRTQPRFKRLDVAALEKAATAAVTAELEAIEDPETRLRRAVAIVNDAERRLPAMRERRDKMAVSLSIYDGVRAINTAAGIGRTQMAKIKRAALGGAELPRTEGGTGVDRDALVRLARRRKVPHVKDALTELPNLAAEVITLSATSEQARKIRDELALAMIEQGTTQARVAEIIGREPSRVAKIVKARQE